jgi:hypothetical protein
MFLPSSLINDGVNLSVRVVVGDLISVDDSEDFSVVFFPRVTIRNGEA